ncbi:MAG TPA: hypothetical protein VK249_05730 [Anaerolineales bacterium]|nr:hypothetical protein [Anaerolineales bacterium]
MSKLIVQTLGTFLLGAVVLSFLLFLPAGTLNYWQAWVFIIVFMISVNIIGVYLTLKDPALLERRKKIGPGAEQSPAQKIIISLAIVADLGLLVFSALDHRFGWSRVPALVSILGDVLAWRILDEEKLLEKDLPGYGEYEQKVHYRLVPYLW